MKKLTLAFATLTVLSLPALLWAIPQQVGGFNNNIMEEEKWERPPNYDEWRLDGQGRDGRAPAAGDPKPQVWVNTKPVDVLGLEAPVGAARLTSDGRRWETVEVNLPARKSDDFHLLQRTLEAEIGKRITAAGKKGERFLSAALKRLKMEIRENAAGGLIVSISRKVAATASAAR